MLSVAVDCVDSLRCRLSVGKWHVGMYVAVEAHRSAAFPKTACTTSCNIPSVLKADKTAIRAVNEAEVSRTRSQTTEQCKTPAYIHTTKHPPL